MMSLQFFYCVKKNKNVEYSIFDKKKNEMREGNLFVYNRTKQNKYTYTHICI